eukprot:CAMPEP_0184449742 /NCGR_PEP_ID=MMETSP0740-20130409/5294_1 /TAXON_ID=385413 /ORGANISM="Thalassiosira miniscula, Strain CCMP1093" /LENGTH=74 /DNA_ID=CAMNT_0026819899 /DNA_START=413 /DNA_END=634 /DNA_ORIENTATION=-
MEVTDPNPNELTEPAEGDLMRPNDSSAFTGTTLGREGDDDLEGAGACGAGTDVGPSSERPSGIRSSVDTCLGAA